jgi:hypothetical protein
MPNLKELAGQVIEAMRGYVARELAPLTGRLAQLDAAIKAIPAGKDGAPGRDGKDGAPGKDGERGLQGEKGEQGPAGVNGKDGAAGRDGKDGEQGPRGEQGAAGIAGKDGAPGERGERGERGEPGKDGAAGKDGREGVDGKDGAPGLPGEKGDAGAAGRDGIDGKPGRDGERGEKGDKGDRGEDGAPGARGADGLAGERGLQGVAGKDGQPGTNGKDGRDALELTVLPAIDEKRSYPRNTYARHRGGLWRAFEDTLGMRGWECVVVGVHEISVEQVDERRFSLSMALSAGEALLKEFVLPVVIDRGVYRPEQKYAKGDGVTFGGSFWIAQVDEPTEKPSIPAPGTAAGATGEWRLAVKKGRDGKDAVK